MAPRSEVVNYPTIIMEFSKISLISQRRKHASQLQQSFDNTGRDFIFGLEGNQLGEYLRSEIIVLHGRTIFSSVKNCQTVF